MRYNQEMLYSAVFQPKLHLSVLSFLLFGGYLSGNHLIFKKIRNSQVKQLVLIRQYFGNMLAMEL